MIHIFVIIDGFRNLINKQLHELFLTIKEHEMDKHWQTFGQQNSFLLYLSPQLSSARVAYEKMCNQPAAT